MAWDDTPPDTTDSWDSRPPDESLGQQGLEAGGKALDYQRGAVTPVVASVLSKLSGKSMQDILPAKEYSAAVNPTTTARAPNSDTMLARAGVPQGPHLSDVAPALFAPPGSTSQFSWWNPMRYAAEKGGMMDVTPRGVAGGAMDMATDPLTYESFGVNKLIQGVKNAGQDLSPALKSLSALFNPASNTVEAAGKKAYESGMSPLISQGEKYGKDVADTLYENGMWGRPSSVAKQGDLAAEGLKSDRDALMANATAKGAQPDVVNAFQPLQDHLQDLVANGRISVDEARQVLEKAVGSKASVVNPTVEQMSQWKTDLNNSLPNSAFDVTKDPKMAQKFTKIAAGGNKDEVVRAMNAAEPGLGDALNDKNQELGNLLTVQGVADKQAAREGNARLIAPNAGNHALTTGLVTGNPVAAMAHAAGSTALRAFNDRTVRNSLGYLARKAGTNAVTAPLIDAAAANTLRNMANKNQPVAGVGR